jgi:ABC-type Zn2+ transport system substrate-binding protein/surface adhesin
MGVIEVEVKSVASVNESVIIDVEDDDEEDDDEGDEENEDDDDDDEDNDDVAADADMDVEGNKETFISGKKGASIVIGSKISKGTF